MRQRITAFSKRITGLLNAKKYTTRPLDCAPHMNELPVPCGPWGPWYKEQQDFYRNHLFVGFAWWLFSLGMAIYTNAFQFEYWGPPAQPSAPSDMVEECDDADT